MKFLLVAALVFSFSAQANTCKRLVDCVTEASKLTGIKYIYPENLFTKEELNVELILNKENADTVLSEALNVYDYMKLPSKVENVWLIIHGRDIRYNSALPVYKASKKITPDLPKNHDPIHFEYQAAPGTEIGEIARNLRPFMSRYGRLIDLKSGMLIVIDRAAVVSQILPIIQAADVPMTKAERAAYEKKRAQDQAMELEMMKKAPMPANK